MQEVEAICDRIIIVDQGIIVADEEKSNIYSVIKGSKQIVQIEFDKEVNEVLMLGIDNVYKVRNVKNNIWLIESTSNNDIRPSLFNFAVSNNLTVLSMNKHESNLEEVFRHLTNQ
jgi:ABC-2 type transport system ATP-binding protein